MAKKRILVVDDSQFLVTILSNTLRNAGYDVDEASDVKEAVLALKKSGPPDLLIMDLNLPDLRGDQAVQALRKAPACAKLPVIYISGLREETLADITRQTNANGYMKKPFSPSSILRWIRENADLLDVMEGQRSSLPPSRPSAAVDQEPASRPPGAPEGARVEPSKSPAEAPTGFLPQASSVAEALSAPPVPAWSPETAAEVAAARKEAAAASRPPSPPKGSQVEGGVMIIDDSTFLQQVLRDTLEGSGYAVHQAGDVMTGTNMLKNIVPEIILLDVHLPDMQGDEACSILKAIPTCAGIPIYLISSGAEDRLKARAAACGADGYLRKPFTPVTILNWLRQHGFRPAPISVIPPKGKGAIPPVAGEMLVEEAPEAPPVGEEAAADDSRPQHESLELPPEGPDRDRALMILQSQLSKPDPALRAQAAYCFGEVRYTDALPLLRSKLQDPDSMVVADCLWAIGEMKDPLSVNDIERMLRSTEASAQDLSVRMRAIEALGKIGDAKAIKTIAVCLDPMRPTDEKIVAIQALADLGTEEVREDLQRLMFEAEGEVQRLALEALEKIKIRTMPPAPVAAGEEPEEEELAESETASGDADDLANFLESGLE